MSQHTLVDEALPLLLAEELLDISDATYRKRLFSFIEENQTRLLEGMIPNRGKGLVLLRVCNELLKRSSKSTDAHFCGRILLFLSKVFPLSERSALNLRGAFNLDNELPIDEPLPSDLPLQGSVDTKTVLAGLDDDKTPISYPFYARFWQFQSFCVNPSSVFPQWSTFTSMVVDIVSLFEAIQPLVASSSPTPSTVNDVHPKYLSSRRLLKYQLRDAGFKLRISSQLYLLFGHLLDTLQQPSTVEEKVRNKQLEFTKYGLTKVGSLVQRFATECGPERINYEETMRSILSAETFWVDWKRNNCPSFEKPPCSDAVLIKPLPDVPMDPPLQDSFKRKLQEHSEMQRSRTLDRLTKR